MQTHRKVLELQETGDIRSAIAQLRKIGKLGPMGEIPSYAKPVAELNTTVTQMVATGRESITPIAEKLMSGKSESAEAAESSLTDADQVKLLWDYIKLSEDYKGFKPLRNDLAKINKLIGKDDDLSAKRRDLQTIFKSKSANTKSSIKRALKKLDGIVESHKEGQIADKASAAIDRLKEIQGK